MTKQKDGKDGNDLSTSPFGKCSGEVFSYSQFEELKEILTLAVQEKSMALVTGQAGVGKTTATAAFVNGLPTNRYAIIYVGQDLDGGNLARRFARSLGLQSQHHRSITWLSISHHLSDNLIEQGKEVVLIIDEAHLLDNQTLENIRLLTNADFDRTSPLTVIMLGQLILRSRLKANGFEALNQRLRFRYALEGLTEEETANYIKHRLRIAGLNPELFTVDALKYIFLAAQGIPREINNLCTQAIIKAKNENANKIDGKLIKRVLDQREVN
jgi:type II secretory pathway predicted ATPase ExeA